MTTKRKRHERIKNNPADVRFEEAEAWLFSVGFQEREATRCSLIPNGMVG